MNQLFKLKNNHLTPLDSVPFKLEKEIQNIPIGTALITGLTDVPLFVNIRPRLSKHGGRAEKILDSNNNFLDKVHEFDKKEILPESL